MRIESFKTPENPGMAKIRPYHYTYVHSIPVGSRRRASLSEKEESLCCQSTISTFS
jgi:hypothetical protein